MADYEQPKPEDAKPEVKPEQAEYDAALVGWTEMQDAKNIVPFFLSVPDVGAKWLGELSKQVCDDHSSAWDGSETYRLRRQKNYQRLTGFLPKQDFPWPNAANTHMPVMLERYLRLTANVFVEIFTDREAIFAVEPTGPDDQEQAEILTLHGNWQVKNELTDFMRQQLRGLGEFFASGSVFSHSYYDPIKGRNRHDTLNCEELVIPYVWTTVETDMSDVPYKIRLLRKHKNELQQLGASGEWEQVDALLAKGPPAWDVLETGVRDKAAANEGIVKPTQSKRAPWVLLEYHGWARMPGEDRERPICAIVDLHSKAVVKLYLREEEDWRDRMRFDREQGEFEAYAQDQAAFPQRQMEFESVQAQTEGLRQRLAMPDVMPEERMGIEEALAAEPLEPPQPPTPPAWLKEGMQGPEPVRRVPIEMFSHGVCFENPNGTLGLAPGHILADLNALVDESNNHYFNAATLANVWSALVPENFDIGSQTLAVTPGKLIKVRGFTGENLKNAVHELKAAPANPQLLDVIRMATEAADSSVAAPGVLSGEAGKSGETFRGIATRIERATRQLSQAGMMYCDYLANVLKNNARLNALFMPDDQLVLVGNHFAEVRAMTLDPMTGAPMPEIRLTRDMYRRDYRVTFTADVRFQSQAERVAQADEVLGMIAQIPPLQGNNALLHATVSKALRARGMGDLIPMLGPPPPPPTVPMGTPPSMPPGMPGPAGEMPPGGPPPSGALPPEAQGPVQGPQPGAQA